MIDNPFEFPFNLLIIQTNPCLGHKFLSVVWMITRINYYSSTETCVYYKGYEEFSKFASKLKRIPENWFLSFIKWKQYSLEDLWLVIKMLFWVYSSIYLFKLRNILQNPPFFQDDYLQNKLKIDVLWPWNTFISLSKIVS